MAVTAAVSMVTATLVAPVLLATPAAAADPAVCSDQATLINPSFEKNTPSSAYYSETAVDDWFKASFKQQSPDADPLNNGWRIHYAAAPADDDLFEVWASNPANTQYYPTAADGANFIEMNMYEPGIAYQDIATPPGETMYWSLNHRARDTATFGTQKVEVLIGPATGDISTWTGTSQGEFTATSDLSWDTRTGTYTVPLGQTATRFAFRSTASNNPSVGNFLDNIQFSVAATACSDTATVRAGTQVDTSVLGNDQGVGLSVTSVGTVSPAGAQGTASVQSGGVVRFTPNAAFSGTATVPYTIQDSHSPTPNSSTSEVTVTVTPLGVDDTYSSVTGDQANELDVLANDGGSGTKTLATVSTPSHGTASISNGKISYTPTTGYSGSDSFTYTYTADGGTSQTVTANLTVQNSPGAPTVVSVIPGDTVAQLTWSAPGSDGGLAITDYVLERSPNPGSTWTTISDGTSTSTSHLVTGLSNGTNYKFRVSAVNSHGTGAASSDSSAITPHEYPAAPPSHQISGSTFSWGDPHTTWVSSKASTWVFYRKTGDTSAKFKVFAHKPWTSPTGGGGSITLGGTTLAECDSDNPTWTCVVPTNLAPNTSYDYRVAMRRPTVDGYIGGTMTPALTHTTRSGP